MNFLFLEPFYGGSHRDFADGLIAHSRHRIDLVTLPARFWKWRMRGAALYLAGKIQAPCSYDGLIVTGSQDKLIKLWSVDELQLQHTFTGHTKGVWCVRFSPIDKVVASCSSDGTIKVWAVNTLDCIRSIDCSIFNLAFLKRGTQLVTCGSDGLVKVWDVKSSDCMLTLNEHEGNVWSLSIDENDKVIVSGSSDGTFIGCNQAQAAVLGHLKLPDVCGL